MRSMLMRQDSTAVLESAREAMSNYSASEETRYTKPLRNVAINGSNADYHIANDMLFYRMIERMREIDRNDCVVGQGVRRFVNKVLRSGMIVDPDTGSPDLDDELRGQFNDWAADDVQCDFSHEHNLLAIAKMVLHSMIVDGDICAILRESEIEDGPGSIQLMEAHRLRTPPQLRSLRNGKSCIHGVSVDKDSRRLAFYFTQSDIGFMPQVPNNAPMIAVAPFDDFGNRIALHLFNPHRKSQTRGISALAPTADIIGMSAMNRFSTLVQAASVSNYAFIHEYEKIMQIGATTGGATGAATANTKSLMDGTTDLTEVESIPGQHYHARPGEKLTMASPNVPGTQYLPFELSLLKLIAANIGTTLQTLLLDCSENTYSGWRGGQNEADVGVEDWQQILIDDLYRPLYVWKVDEFVRNNPALGKDLARSRLNPRRHNWTAPVRPYVEPLKDAQADALRLNENLASLEEVHAERGGAWRTRLPRIIAGRMEIIERSIVGADYFNGKYPGAEVHWRDVANMHVKKAAPTADDPDNEDDAPPKKKSEGKSE